MFKKAVYWFAAMLASLFAAFLFFEQGLDSHLVIFISALSGIVVLYLARKKKEETLPKDRRRIYVVAGLLISFFSFVNQIFAALGLGIVFWNPPYSIGEFGVLVSGLSIIYFALLGCGPLVVPAGFPALVIIVYQIYDSFRDNVEWIAAPLLGPTTGLSVAILNALGIHAVQSAGYIIRFISRDGQQINIQIVTDCTGIWSLSAFTASLILVSFGWRKVFSKKAAPYILAGYVGTYAANIFRIIIICVSAYLYGHLGAIESVHVHAGWIAFSVWMLIFWYFFFSRFLLKNEKNPPDK